MQISYIMKIINIQIKRSTDRKINNKNNHNCGVFTESENYKK